MKALERNKMWGLLDIPYEKEVVGLKWIYKIEYQVDGSVPKYKARLVAHEYMQREGIDFEETLSLVARFDTIRIVLSIYAHFHWKVYQFDVKSTFLN